MSQMTAKEKYEKTQLREDIIKTVYGMTFMALTEMSISATLKPEYLMKNILQVIHGVMVDFEIKDCPFQYRRAPLMDVHAKFCRMTSRVIWENRLEDSSVMAERWLMEIGPLMDTVLPNDRKAVEEIYAHLDKTRIAAEDAILEAIIPGISGMESIWAPSLDPTSNDAIGLPGGILE